MMKNRSKIVIVLAIIVLMGVSFFVGSYVTEQKNSNTRIQRCSTLIKFAIDKAENGDLTDDGTMRGLISNVYAAYQFCDDSKVANQLHALWNYLIFENDGNFESAKEIVLIELNDALRTIKTSN